jgi:uncharacterized protein (TIGR03790 family)
LLSVTLALLLTGCRSKPSFTANYTPTADSRRVLVVYNSQSEFGEEIADYYATHRRVPAENLVSIQCPDTEEVSDGNYRDEIEAPIRAALRKTSNAIDFIVLTKGVPIRMADDQHYSVDAWIAASDLPITPIRKLTEESLKGSLNPYFGSIEPFSSKKFGFYLVTRIDGYNLDDCKKLVDRSLEARPEKGPFLFDEAANRKDPNYEPTQQGLVRAAKILQSKRFDVDLDTTKAFIAPPDPLAGYASWGSNDADFDLSAYRKLRFKPGALCETFVSTSGRTFKPTVGGQSLIADLIAAGVTGVKGYVSEPFTFALAKPEILFDRYTGGRNLAESFYAASQFLKWKDVVIGDPLCAPYKQ